MAKHWISMCWAGFVGGMVMLAGSALSVAAPGPTTVVRLDGKLRKVVWLDGDTFHSRGGPRVKARLEGYNTLENYGPVHRWGRWKARELDRINERATKVARSKAWKCVTLPGGGGYGRDLIRCAGLAKALLRQGLAHTYSVRGSANPRWNAIQRKAQRQGRGIWAKGVPAYIVTSVHSVSRRYPRAYIRLISTRDGSSKKLRHKKRFRVCQWVCRKGSCMLFVPYRRRFGFRRAKCLR